MTREEFAECYNDVRACLLETMQNNPGKYGSIEIKAHGHRFPLTLQLLNGERQTIADNATEKPSGLLLTSGGCITIVPYKDITTIRAAVFWPYGHED